MNKNNIQYFREQKKLTQEQMAERLDMPISTYGKIERGETAIVHKHLQNIADILEVAIYQLLPEHNINHFENNNIHIGIVQANNYHDNQPTTKNDLGLVLNSIQHNQEQLIENQKLLIELLQKITLTKNT